MPSGNSLFIADCEELALDILASGLWTACSGAKENHEGVKKKKKLSVNENLHSLCAACSRSVEGKEIWTEEEKLTLRKETGKMIFSCLCL